MTKLFRNLPTTKTIALASFTALIGVVTYNVVSIYGFRGAIRLIWEGDHLPAEVRLAMDQLDEIEYSKLPKQERLLELLEISVGVASLNSVDGGETNNNLPSTVSLLPGKIKKDVAMLSSALDDLAASIDSVQSLQNKDVKGRKKLLSQIAVDLMERVDYLICQIEFL